MFKNNYILFLCLVGLGSCKKELEPTKMDAAYTITIKAQLKDHTKVYLSKFNSEHIQKIDSTNLMNQTAVFTGHIAYPERQLITIDDVFGGLVFIVENDSIAVTVRNNDLINAQITGSLLNNQLHTFKTNLDKIYSKVDVLFPELQRARLENDAVNLKALSEKMYGIEAESIDYSFNYASENLDSYIAAIILNDLSLRDSIDLKRIATLYKKMATPVKKSPDAKELGAFLKTHK